MLVVVLSPTTQNGVATRGSITGKRDTAYKMKLRLEFLYFFFYY